MKTTLAFAAASALALFACDSNPGETLSLVGKTPAAQAEAVATLVCERESRCGEVAIDCVYPQRGPRHCQGNIRTTDFAECKEARVAEGIAQLEACALTDSELRLVETCVNAVASEPCITEAALQAYIDALNAGDDDPAPLGVQPEECDEVEGLFKNCRPEPEP